MTTRHKQPAKRREGDPRRPPKGGRAPSPMEAVAAARKAAGLTDSVAEQLLAAASELAMLRGVVESLRAQGAAPAVVAAIRAEIPKLERKVSALRDLRARAKEDSSGTIGNVADRPFE